MDKPRDYRPLLVTGRWFGGLPDSLQDALLGHAHVKTLRAGAHACRRGDSATGLSAVLDGALRMVGITEQGNEVLHMFVEPPSWFGELSIIDGLPRSLEVIAEVDCTLLQVPQPAVEALLAAEPRYWQDLARLLAYRFRLAMFALEDGQASSPLARLARRLSLMIEGYGDHAHRRRTIAVSQQQLAKMLHISRQTANQLLHELVARGLIRLAYGEIEILDDPGLRELARLG